MTRIMRRIKISPNSDNTVESEFQPLLWYRSIQVLRGIHAPNLLLVSDNITHHNICYMLQLCYKSMRGIHACFNSVMSF